MACVLNSCCGCISLRVGSFIIAYMGAIGSFFGVIFAIGGVIISATRRNEVAYELHLYYNTLMWGCVVFLVTFSICYAIYVTLLVGLHQERPTLVKLFLKLMTMYLVITFILVLLMIVFVDAYLGLRCIISYACSIYYMLVIRSYYLELKQSKELETTSKPV